MAPLVKLDYEPDSFCGPADLRVARELEEYRHIKFDPAYLRHIQEYHGGIPKNQYFTAQNGHVYRVGRFLTMLDRDSTLEPPPRPSWQPSNRDIRLDWSVDSLTLEEGPVCRQLFGTMIPFAALYIGTHHPDRMGLGDGNCELLCFLYEPSRKRPRVVVWLPSESFHEFTRREEAKFDQVHY